MTGAWQGTPSIDRLALSGLGPKPRLEAECRVADDVHRLRSGQFSLRSVGHRRLSCGNPGMVALAAVAPAILMNLRPVFMVPSRDELSSGRYIFRNISSRQPDGLVIDTPSQQPTNAPRQFFFASVGLCPVRHTAGDAEPLSVGPFCGHSINEQHGKSN